MEAAVAVHHTLELVPTVVQAAAKVAAPLILIQKRSSPIQVMAVATVVKTDVTAVVKTDVTAVVKSHVATAAVAEITNAVEACVV